jgi:ABC-type sugar transport system permease subunit
MINFRSKSVISIIFFLPALAIMLFFFAAPILSTFYFALFDWDILNTTTMKFVGFDNFKDLFMSKEFFTALTNTVIYALLVAFFNNFIGLLLALGLDMGLKTRNLLRTVFFIPSLISAVVSGYIWTFLYHPQMGIPNFLTNNLHLGLFNQDWLGDPKIVLFSIIFVAIWQFSGYYMIIYITGLQGVPTELYEACKIDGANWWLKFWKVTFPMISPAITIGIVTATIGSLKVFDQVYVMTRGGPGYASETLTTLLVSKTFFLNKAGYGVTISLVLFVLVFAVSLIQIGILRKREEIF